MNLLKAAADRAEYCLIQRRVLLKVLDWRQWELRAASSIDEDAEQNGAPAETASNERLVSPAFQMLDKMKEATLVKATDTVLALKVEFEVSQSIPVPVLASC